MRKELPLGNQSLARIRGDNCVYVDKTSFAYQLLTTRQFVFLARPRRFGKTLFVDTLQEIAQGNRALFQGLYIYDRWDWSLTYPVVRIALQGEFSSPEALKLRLNEWVAQNELRLGLTQRPELPYDLRFNELIHAAQRAYGQKVVVLIDEYDKPLLNNIGPGQNPEARARVLEGNRVVLRAFYEQIKQCDAAIKLAFITGITKFSQVSIFSGLNNLLDISLDPHYAEICGVTQTELEHNFADYLEGIDLARMKAWYNGYNFLGENLYNTYEVLLFLYSRRFRSYWATSGLSEHLVAALSLEMFTDFDSETLTITDTQLQTFRAESLAPIPLLFYAGYLTVAEEYYDDTEALCYRLRIPNREVAVALNDSILALVQGDQPQALDLFQNDLRPALQRADFPRLQVLLTALFAGIPYSHFVKNPMHAHEAYYATVLYAFLRSTRLPLVAEDFTNHGRADLTLFLPDKIYLFEFKVGTADALAQIHQRRYYEKYLDQEKAIYLVGINFSAAERNLAQLEWEVYKGK